jgi:hypothetical protein
MDDDPLFQPQMKGTRRAIRPCKNIRVTRGAVAPPVEFRRQRHPFPDRPGAASALLVASSASLVIRLQ